jgi:cellulose synthase operon protein YhjQ
MGNEKKNESKLGTETTMPEDVAILYSWANLHGAKYRDFSATRQEARSQARNRAHLEQLEKEAGQEAAPAIEIEAASAVERTIAPQQAEIKAEPAVRGAWEELVAPGPVEARVISDPATPPAQRPDVYLETPRTEPRPPAAPALSAAEEIGFDEFRVSEARHGATSSSADVVAPQITDLPTVFRTPAQAPRFEAASAPSSLPSRDSANARWFTLNSILNQPGYGSDTRPQRAREVKVPVLAVFSLAGGVGKTGIVATLGRALAARGEKVLLVDTNSYGLLPLYYGAQDVRLGVVRTFSGDTSQAKLQLLSLDAERYAEQPAAGWNELANDIVRSSQGTDRVLLDVATGSSSLTRQILCLSPTVLVPLVPDVSSLASLQAVESFFGRQSDALGRATEPVYLLNRFDSSLPLHHEMREVLRQRLGERLLPITLRRTPALSEALAEGMTVVDYSPGSLIVEDYGSLSTWLRNLSAPAGSVFRGHRWSEQ